MAHFLIKASSTYHSNLRSIEAADLAEAKRRCLVLGNATAADRLAVSSLDDATARWKVVRPEADATERTTEDA